MIVLRIFFAFVIFTSFLSYSLIGQESSNDVTPIINYKDRFHSESGLFGMVSTQEALSTEIGVRILEKGGNAIDAAVAVGYAMSVALPRAGNLGGGGFMMIYLASENRVLALDYREVAPLSATTDMFLTSNEIVDRAKAQFSVLASGVPGTIAGLSEALEKYGTMTLEEVIQPAIHLAEKGIVVNADLSNSLRQVEKHLKKSPDSKRIFYPSDKAYYEIGDRLYQPQLSQTLRLIAQSGPDAFYNGVIGDQLVSFMQSNGGLISKDDLKDYSVVWREPIKSDYRGFTVFAMPPPSSGGIHLVQLLNLVEPYEVKKMGHNSSQAIHLFSQAMKLVYADRSKFLGDPDFVYVPSENLVSKKYANQLRSTIKMSVDVSSEQIFPGDPSQLYESEETTHYSIADRWGNMVANTYTLNFSYGSGWMIPETGILLNNQMDDFSAKPGAPNAYGLIGGKNNSIEPKKRMLSSMTPTIVLKDGRPFLATGTPGGSRIITTVFQQLINLFDFNLSLAESITSPRMHHQWWPDELRVESGFSKDTLNLLRNKGHKIVEKNAMGSLNSVMIHDNVYYGYSDTRKPGALSKGVMK